MFNFSSIPLRYRKQRTSLNISHSYDDFEYYRINYDLNNLNGGVNWTGIYISRNNPLGITTWEDFESYTSASNLNGLNYGNNWSGSYVSRNGLLGIISQDDFESYTSASNLGGLNGGTSGWSGSYVVEPLSAPIIYPTYQPTLPSTMSISASSGATIYYTIDGSVPTTSSLFYTGSFVLSNTASIKAIAVQNGYRNSSTASASYPSVFYLPSNLIHYWQFYNHSGDTIPDLTGSNAATNHGGIFTSDGLVFNGSTTYAETTTFAIGSNNVSILIWMKFPVGTGGIVYSQEPVNTGFLFIQNAASSTNQIDFRGDGSPYDNVSATTPSTNTWHQIVGTITSGNSCRIYVDGTLVGGPATLSNTFTNVSRVLSIARYNNAGYWSGSMGIMQICNGVLSAAEVSAAWTGQRGLYGV
jgi:hypothetical protein